MKALNEYLIDSDGQSLLGSLIQYGFDYEELSAAADRGEIEIRDSMVYLVEKGKPRATAEQFFAICAAGKTAKPLTQPQARILNYLRAGYKIWTVNEHRQSGGELAWKAPDREDPEYAGRIYKAFFGLMWTVLKDSEYDSHQTPVEFTHVQPIKVGRL